MAVVTRPELASAIGVSLVTLKRRLPELELSGRLKPQILPGKGSPLGYDLDEAIAAIKEQEANGRVFRNSSRWTGERGRSDAQHLASQSIPNHAPATGPARPIQAYQNRYNIAP